MTYVLHYEIVFTHHHINMVRVLCEDWFHIDFQPQQQEENLMVSFSLIEKNYQAMECLYDLLSLHQILSFHCDWRME